MGNGIDAARQMDPEHTQHADLLDDLKDQLLIIFLKRLGGSINIPVGEIDNTGMDLFSFSVDPHTGVFKFRIQQKQ